jgi:hypothetical protein
MTKQSPVLGYCMRVDVQCSLTIALKECLRRMACPYRSVLCPPPWAACGDSTTPITHQTHYKTGCPPWPLCLSLSLALSLSLFRSLMYLSVCITVIELRLMTSQGRGPQTAPACPSQPAPLSLSSPLWRRSWSPQHNTESMQSDMSLRGYACFLYPRRRIQMIVTRLQVKREGGEKESSLPLMHW